MMISLGPTINGPTDLPVLRQWLMAVTNRYPHLFTLSTGFDPHRREGTVIARTLTAAQLWWVEQEMCDVIAAAAPTFPDDEVLTFDTLPALAGLAVLAKPFIMHDARVTGKQVQVDAIAWGPATLRVGDKAAPAIIHGFFRRLRLEDGIDMASSIASLATLWLRTLALGKGLTMGQNAELRGDVFAYLGRSEWLFDTPVAHRDSIEDAIANVGGLDEGVHDAFVTSAIEDRKYVATLWRLAGMRSVALTVTLPVDRAARRRAARDGIDDPAVRVVSLRRHERGESGPGDGSRQYHVRWVVSPHWRRQPYGPKRALRRLVLVGPYEKGPEGAPLVGGERVFRVAAPRDP